ncbi:MAG: sugar phosphate isomerase/epimerase, partial [Planctomycetota bacterium]
EYAGWILLEAGGEPEDRIAALKEQQALFDALVKKSSA